jgi:hypothetical protein
MSARSASSVPAAKNRYFYIQAIEYEGLNFSSR